MLSSQTDKRTTKNEERVRKQYSLTKETARKVKIQAAYEDCQDSEIVEKALLSYLESNKHKIAVA